jgi:hypothetical protein
MTKAIQTAIKLLENLPEATQETVVEELRRLALEAQDEAKWEKRWAKPNSKLRATVRKVRQEIAADKATDMDFDRL